MVLKDKIPFVFFLFFMILNFALWTKAHKVQAEWGNVPPVPTLPTSRLFALGDSQFAYRIYATMLQNLGNSGGKFTSLKEYDFATLEEWFFLTDKLDPQSDAVPMMAAQYFGAIDQKDKLNHIFDYLSHVGRNETGEKWRWLAHAVFLARHVAKDNDKALELAYILAENKNPDMADWAKQMPAFILQDKGDIELAYKIMLNILVSNIDSLHPNEVNYMVDYICNTLLPDLPDTKPPKFCTEEIK